MPTPAEVNLALAKAIPPEAIQELCRLPYEVNGNNNYISGWNPERIDGDWISVVSSYNNTRESEQEIIEWFERAKLLA